MDTSHRTAIIRSIGTAVPPHKISQKLHYSILENANGMNRAEKLVLRKVYQNSGINSRHSVLEEFANEDRPDNLIFHPAGLTEQVSVSKRMKLFEEFSKDLCSEAVRNCIAKTDLKLTKVTHLITFSCTGMSAPGIDIQLVESLGLNRNVERTCINFMGCYAGLNALKIADYIVRANENAIVLLCGIELCTLHYQKSFSHDQVIANALFADGAAAAIVTSEIKNKNTTGLSLEEFYSEFEPSGINDMAWRIGEFGFDIRLSTYVPDLIEEHITALLNKLFEKSSIKKNDIDWYALHPGGVKILQACEKALGITEEENKHSYDVLKEFGNMSSVTIFFVLKKYLDEITATDKNRNILSCAFGPGLTMESMILRVNIPD